MKAIILAPCLAIILLGSTACQSIVREAVLEPDQAIRFENPNGNGVITYISEDTRRFEFGEGTERTIEMTVRKDRFLGRLGIYHAANRWFFEFWKGKRIVADEASYYFDSLEEAQRFLYQGSAVQNWVYNDQGYVIGYGESPGRNQINISLYRYYIDGSPAWNMPGYDNSKVILIDTNNSQ